MPLGGASPWANDFRATLDVAYEVDLWARVASSTRARRARNCSPPSTRATRCATRWPRRCVQSYAALQSLDAQYALFQRAVRCAARRPEAAARALRCRRHLRARHAPARGGAARATKRSCRKLATRARRGRTRAGAVARPLASARAGAGHRRAAMRRAALRCRRRRPAACRPTCCSAAPTCSRPKRDCAPRARASTWRAPPTCPASR